MDSTPKANQEATHKRGKDSLQVLWWWLSEKRWQRRLSNTKVLRGYGWKGHIPVPDPVGNQRAIRPHSLDEIWLLQNKMGLKRV